MNDKPDNGPAASSENIDVLARFLPQVPNTAAHKADAMMARRKLTEEIGKLEHGPGEGDSAFGRKVGPDDAEAPAPKSERAEAIGLAPAAPAVTKETLRGLAPVVAEAAPTDPAVPAEAPPAASPAPAPRKPADPSPDEPRVIVNLPNQTQKLEKAAVNLHLAAMPTVRNLRVVAEKPGAEVASEPSSAPNHQKTAIIALSAVICVAAGAAFFINRSNAGDPAPATAATSEATATATAEATAEASAAPIAETTAAPEATAAPAAEATATAKTAPTVGAAPAVSAKAAASVKITPTAASAHPVAAPTNVPYGGSKPEF